MIRSAKKHPATIEICVTTGLKWPELLMGTLFFGLSIAVLCLVLWHGWQSRHQLTAQPGALRDFLGELTGAAVAVAVLAFFWVGFIRQREYVVVRDGWLSREYEVYGVRCRLGRRWRIASIRNLHAVENEFDWFWKRWPGALAFDLDGQAVRSRDPYTVAQAERIIAALRPHLR